MWQMQIVENLATVKEAVKKKKKKKAYWLYHTFVCFTAEKPPQTL